MTARISPYLRYYSSHRPTDDHGDRPVVFEDEFEQTHFLRVARDEMQRAGGRRSPAGLPQEPDGEGRAARTGVAHDRRPNAELRIS